MISTTLMTTMMPPLGSIITASGIRRHDASLKSKLETMKLNESKREGRERVILLPSNSKEDRTLTDLVSEQTHRTNYVFSSLKG